MLRFLAVLMFTMTFTPALASSVAFLNLTLRIDAIYWYDVEIKKYMEDPDYPGDIGWFTVDNFNRYDQGQGSYDSYLYHPLSHFNVGEEINLSARVHSRGTGGYQGGAESCTIGGFDCKTLQYDTGYVTPDKFFIYRGHSDRMTLSGSMHESGMGSFQWRAEYQGYVGYFDNDQTHVSWGDSFVDFTVVKNNLVVTPLPASLSMLAAGVLGMGWLARRRKTLS